MPLDEFRRRALARRSLAPALWAGPEGGRRAEEPARGRGAGGRGDLLPTGGKCCGPAASDGADTRPWEPGISTFRGRRGALVRSKGEGGSTAEPLLKSEVLRSLPTASVLGPCPRARRPCPGPGA